MSSPTSRPRCSSPIGWSPARRPPGPKASGGGSAGARPRPAARSWPCSSTTPPVTPAPSSRWWPPSKRWPRVSRSSVPGCARWAPADPPGTSAVTRRWPPAWRAPSGGGRRWASPTGPSPPSWRPGTGRSCRRVRPPGSWPRSRSPPSSVPSWPTSCAGSVSARWGSSPPSRPPTCWPASVRTARQPTTRPPGGTTGPSPPARRRPTTASRWSWTRRPSGSTPPPSRPRRWPTASTPGWLTTAWPAPASPSRPRPSTASRCGGCGATTAPSPRRRSPIGCAGSWTAGWLVRPAPVRHASVTTAPDPTGTPPAGSCWSASSPTRCGRTMAARPASGAGRPRVTSGPPGPWRVSRACSVRMRCAPPCCRAAATRPSR